MKADPPDPDKLMKALKDLEESASSDAAVREKIAKLPSSVNEVSQLANLKSVEEGQRLLKKVEDAEKLLADYNERLQQELKDRRKVGKMIADFLQAQKFLEDQAEGR